MQSLAGIAVAAGGNSLPDTIAAICEGVNPTETGRRASPSRLRTPTNALVLLGNIAGRHAAYTAVRALAACIAESTGAAFGGLSEGPNSAGAHLAGAYCTNRTAGAAKTGSQPAWTQRRCYPASIDAVVLVNVEPDSDIHATSRCCWPTCRNQNFVVALTPFVSDGLLECADLLLPTGTFAETSGTYINIEGTWQSFSGVASPVGDARPAWKVLRVLGNLIDAPGFDYVTSEDVREEFVEQLGEVRPDNVYEGTGKITKPKRWRCAGRRDRRADVFRLTLWSARAFALQQTDEARPCGREGSDTT